jgi:ribosomal protein L11 methyltransferase
VAVRVAAEEAEAARARLVELFPEGFEEADAGSCTELAAYTDAAGEEHLRAAFGAVVVSAVEPGWEDAWRRFHRPVRIGPLWVGPPWESASGGSLAVVVDPGRAFGTGAHATTRLCLELLLGLRRTSLVDIGCGSGVIAIAAAKLGFTPVIALDSDPVAVEVARVNARANEAAVAVLLADAVADPLPEAETAVANIALEPVEALAPRLRSDVLVASGYRAGERPRLAGWRPRARLERDGWAADVFAGT